MLFDHPLVLPGGFPLGPSRWAFIVFHYEAVFPGRSEVIGHITLATFCMLSSGRSVVATVAKPAAWSLESAWSSPHTGCVITPPPLSRVNFWESRSGNCAVVPPVGDDTPVHLFRNVPFEDISTLKSEQDRPTLYWNQSLP